jgi:hypothetical protein
LRPLPFDLALDCATALCCASFRDDLAKPVEVPWTLIWSRRDRIVDDAYDPQARTVEIDTSHLGMITSATGRAAIVKAVEA